MGILLGLGTVACASGPRGSVASREIVISVKEQKLALMEQGQAVAVYPVSTSKFGLGDTPNRYGTPLGRMKVAQKIGEGAPLGAVFKNRRPTGEVLPPNAPGRDPIVTRILRLTGQESQNARAFARNIYIHGTPEESTIGRPASYGCVRMKSTDVVDLYNRIPNGTEVTVTKGRLPGPARALARQQAAPATRFFAGGSLVARLKKPTAQASPAQVAASSRPETFGPPVR